MATTIQNPAVTFRPQARVQEGQTELNLLLMGDIGGWAGVNREDFFRCLQGSNNLERINVALASPGGDVQQAFALYNLIKLHPAQTTVYLIGECASAATLFAMAFDNVVATPASIFMIHEAWQYAAGNKRELRKSAEALEAHDNILVKVYRERTERSEEEVLDLMEREVWMGPEEMIELGFADSMVEEVALDYDSELVGSYAGDDWYYWDHTTSTMNFAHKLKGKNIPKFAKSTYSNMENPNFFQKVVDKVRNMFPSMSKEQETELINAMSPAFDEQLSNLVSAKLAESLGSIQQAVTTAFSAAAPKDEALIKAVNAAIKPTVDGAITAAISKHTDEKYNALVAEINKLKTGQTGGILDSGTPPVEPTKQPVKKVSNVDGVKINNQLLFDRLVMNGNMSREAADAILEGQK